jgi:hypothetical protein
MRVLAKLAFIAQAVRWLPTAEAGVHYQVSPCGICGGQTGTVSFSLSVLFHQCSMRNGHTDIHHEIRINK